MATSLGTNAAIVTRVHCIYFHVPSYYSDQTKKKKRKRKINARLQNSKNNEDLPYDCKMDLECKMCTRFNI